MIRKTTAGGGLKKPLSESVSLLDYFLDATNFAVSVVAFFFRKLSSRNLLEKYAPLTDFVIPVTTVARPSKL